MRPNRVSETVVLPLSVYTTRPPTIDVKAVHMAVELIARSNLVPGQDRRVVTTQELSERLHVTPDKLTSRLRVMIGRGELMGCACTRRGCEGGYSVPVTR